MRIWLDQSRMAAYGVTTGDIIAALQANNIELPAGEIETGARQLQVLAQTRFSSPDTFRQLVIRAADTPFAWAGGQSLARYVLDAD